MPILMYPDGIEVCFWSEPSSTLYSKTCVKQPLSKRQKIGFQDQLSLNAGQKYCRMLQWVHSAIAQNFIKSYHLSLRSLFCLFLSGHFTQVLLNMQKKDCTKVQAHPRLHYLLMLMLAQSCSKSRIFFETSLRNFNKGLHDESILIQT